MDRINIVSLNARGLANETKRKELFKLLRKQDNHIVCLQETHSVKEEEKIWSMQWNNTVYFSHANSKSAGTAILLNIKQENKHKLLHSDPNGRYVIIEIQIAKRKFVLCNLYGPNKDEPVFFTEIFAILASTETSELIITGDFNVALDVEMDRIDKHRYAPNTARVLNEFIEQMELLDIWRITHPEDKVYSWFRNKRRKEGSRIDYFLITQGIANSTENASYAHGYKTDHSMVKLNIRSGANPRGPGYWKFNSTLLHDKEFVERANDLIDSASRKYNTANAADRWEMCKNDVTDWAIHRSKTISKSRKQKYNETIKIIESFKQEAGPEPPQLTIAKKELESLIEIQTKSAAFRSKAEWHTLAESNSKRFFGLEKAKYNNKMINLIKCQDGTISDDPSIILNTQKKFYKELYQEDQTVKFKLTNNTEHKISQSERETLDQDITIEELTKAVRSLKREKTPGYDGWTSELVQFFWTRIGSLYHEALQYAIKTKQLHVTARMGVIMLIPKKNRNPIELKGWRPLTMLSICYKILAKTLATRIKPVLNKLISPSQTGFLEGRQISETIRSTIDISSYGKKINGYILMIDFEKCFDKISYNAITGSLRYFNFGPNFTNFVQLLLTNFTSCTTNNGFFSEFFNIDRSCHQGCNLAPYLFLICGEVMNHQIRLHSGINVI